MLKPLEYAYFATAIVNLMAVTALGSNAASPDNQTWQMLHYISKPLLMIILILFYATSIVRKPNGFHKMMIAAFFFSWIGDVALMFVHVNENFFLVGLVGFLITHILYTIVFSKVNQPEVTPILPKKFWVAVPLVIYMVALLSMLVPAITSVDKTKPFLIPVLVYSTAIAIMVLFSINRFRRVGDSSFALVFGGALLFMFSDSLIAINKFMTPLPLAGFFIMVLYITGQWLIAKGALKQHPPREQEAH